MNLFSSYKFKDKLNRMKLKKKCMCYKTAMIPLSGFKCLMKYAKKISENNII